MQTISVQINDPEAGCALALLLAAAGYEVETDINEGTVFISADASEAEVRFLEDRAPQTSAYELACNLRQRMDHPASEAELAELGSDYHNVA